MPVLGANSVRTAPSIESNLLFCKVLANSGFQGVFTSLHNFQ
jgi:hypothetical protein